MAQQTPDPDALQDGGVKLSSNPSSVHNPPKNHSVRYKPSPGVKAKLSGPPMSNPSGGGGKNPG